MRYIFIEGVVCGFFGLFGYFYTRGLPSAAIESLAGWIVDGNTVDNHKIIVETLYERIGCDAPRAVGSAVHRIFTTADVYFHVLCFGGVNFERRFRLGVDTGICSFGYVCYCRYAFGRICCHARDCDDSGKKCERRFFHFS